MMIIMYVYIYIYIYGNTIILYYVAEQNTKGREAERSRTKQMELRSRVKPKDRVQPNIRMKQRRFSFSAPLGVSAH